MVVGKPAPMLDGVRRVKGTVPYGINLELPGMLQVKVVRSLYPHARITNLDTFAAEALPGVVAILTAADFQASEAPDLIYGLRIKDQPVVAAERVRYIGEPVALVAAESREIAEQAAALVEVEYEELPGVYEELEAFQEGAPVLHEAYPDNCFLHAKLRHGDLERAFAAADEIIEETYTSPLAQQASLEPHVTAAQWQEGKLTVWSTTQAPHRVRLTLAEIFHLDPERVRVIVPPLGGGYGGKGHVRLEPMVAALAWKVGGRPVKLALTRAEEFVTVTKHAATIRIKTGVRRDGTFTARQVTMYWNGGAYSDATAMLARSALVRSLGPYRFDAAHVDSYGIYTNLPPAAAFRGAMSSQTTWTYDSHMDTIAGRLGIEPLELRRKNLLRSGDTFATGETLHDIHFDECLESCVRALDWQAPFEHEAGGSRRRGRGMAVMIKSTPASSKSQARLEILADGTLNLYTSTVEMGQGAHTALAQIAADAMGLPLEAVRVIGPDTDLTPFDATTSASRSTSTMGAAIRDSGEKLVAKLLEAAAPLFEQATDRLEVAEGAVRVREDPAERLTYQEVLGRNRLERLEALGEFTSQGGLDPETGQGIGALHYHQGAGACEIELDLETGKLSVLRYAAASFAGQVVNPILAQLQNDGNVIYGLGPALMEEMVVADGQITNPNLSEYQIPSFQDAPLVLESISLEGEGSEIHGIGEMTLPPVAPAIANAIFDAAGVRIRDLPLTPEKILRAIQKEPDED